MNRQPEPISDPAKRLVVNGDSSLVGESWLGDEIPRRGRTLRPDS
jgi:hypothetical protein